MALRFSPARGASVLISASSRGPTGSAATITVGTVSTLSSTASATVANSGTSSAAIFDFGIPQGIPGNIAGPASALTGAIATFASTAASSLQDSGIIVSSVGATYPTTAVTAPTLGTTSAPWYDLHLRNAGSINFNNGDVTITHSTNALSFAGSTGYTFDSKIFAQDTIDLGGSGTTLASTAAGTLTVEGVEVSLNSTAATHTAGTIELGGTGTTLSAPTAGSLAVEGVTVSLNSTAATHTAGTIELGGTGTTLAPISAGILGVEGKQVATLSSTQNWTAQQYFGLSTLTDGATITWDVTNGQKAKVTLNGNRTMLAVTGAVEGATYSLWSIQDSTGSRTLTWTTTGAGSFDFGADGAPTLSTTGSKADLLCFESLSYNSVLKLRFAGIKKGFT